jgi:hypothetical protein
MLANSLTKLQIQLCFISVASGHSFALIILAANDKPTKRQSDKQKVLFI